MSNEKVIEKIRELVDNQNKLVDKINSMEVDMLKNKEEQKIQDRINKAIEDAVKATEAKYKDTTKTKPAEEVKPKEE